MFTLCKKINILSHSNCQLKGVTNIELDAPMFANPFVIPSAFVSLQVWHNTPIAFDRDRAANVFSSQDEDPKHVALSCSG